MSDDLPPVRCDDESTWRHKGEKIDLPRLLRLVEENGGSGGLDLHGADLRGIDASPEAVQAHVEAYAREHGPDAEPPWLSALGTINLDFAHLENAELGEVHLEGATLSGAYLQNAHLLQAHLENASLNYVHLENADLTIAHLDNTWLVGAHLGNADLWATDLENAVLVQAHLENAVLVRAHLENADLRNAHLENADLGDASLDGARWYGCYLDRTRIHRESLGRAIGDELAAKGHAAFPSSFHQATEAYLALKTNFGSIGRYGDASWAYVKERQMEKAACFPTTAGHRWIWGEFRRGARRWRRKNPGRFRRFARASVLGRIRWVWLHLRLLVGRCPSDIKSQIRKSRSQQSEEHLDRPRWLRNWLYELLTGYGERPMRPLVWAAALSILVFPFLFWATGALPDHGRAFTSASPSDIGWAGWGDSIIFSLTSFGTLAFNRLQPDGALANILAAFEGFAGVLIFALFVYTLGNRMSRS